MDLRQLEAFVCVVKLNSFSRAADSIFLSQPTISAHISSLEKELGAQLLIRSTKEVYPTKIGMELYRQAQNILALRDQAVSTVKGFDRDSKGEVHVVASSVPAQYLLPEAIAEFHEQYPNILVHVQQSDSEHAGEALKGCLYDLGVTGMPLAGNKYLQQPFYRDTMVIAYPAKMDVDEQFVRDNLLTFIKTRPFVFRESGSGTLCELENYLKLNGLSLNDLKPVAYFGNTQGVMHAVASGLGITFVSKVAVSQYVQIGAVKTVEIDPDFFSRTFYILQKKEVVLTPIQELFKDFLLKRYNHHFRKKYKRKIVGQDNGVLQFQGKASIIDRVGQGDQISL